VRLCVAGREALLRFCAEHALPHARCGKVVVATRDAERPMLDELERRGRANGLTGLARLGPAGIREHEPHAAGLEGLWVPETGIVDFAAVAEAFAAEVRAAGGAVRTGARVTAARRDGAGWVLETPAGAVRARALVTCAGLQSDRLARRCGAVPGVSIVPFRGEYMALAPAAEHLVRGLVYPVPDPRFPFLGVHLTRLVRGGVEAGPNAVLALAREGYRRRDVSARDLAALFADRGFWRMAARHAATGLAEVWRSHSRTAFVAALRRLVPALGEADVTPAGAGVRAQALAPDGRLVDDFHIVEAPGALHVLNAPSPAATASIAIGEHIARIAAGRFELPARA
jgi:L-2-hydroxyglutarate oxidase